MAVVGTHADQIEIMIQSKAFKVSLIDVAAPEPQIFQPGHEPVTNPAAVHAVATVYQLVQTAAGPIRVWLPPPPGARSQRRWEESFRANSLHPGVIYLDDCRTLNEELVRLGVCRLPRRLDVETLRHCPARSGALCG